MAEDLYKFEDDQAATLPPPPNFKDPALVTSTEEEVRVSEESRADVSDEDSIVSEESRADTSEPERVMESSDPADAIYPSHSTLRPEHRVRGEPFYMEREHGLIYLTHKRWSLTGMGEGLIEAEQDLIEEARAVAPIYLEEPLSSLTIDGVELRDFILRVI